MGKTPKSKNVNYQRKSHLQPMVMLHRPKNIAAGKLAFPGLSEKSDPKRRMKLIGSFSRKPSHGKGFSIKVTSSSIAEQSVELKKISRMSVVAAEASESLVLNHQSNVVLENGEEDSQGNVDEKCCKDEPITNGSEPEPSKLPKSDTSDDVENSKNQAKESNSTQGQIVDGESSIAVKLSGDDDGETKKHRAGTPQRRSATPQRKSERVRTKHGSPSKSNASSSTPGLKVLKINITPARTVTNGTMETKEKMETESSKSKTNKIAECESQKTIEEIPIIQSDNSEIPPDFIQDDNLPEKEIPSLQPSGDKAPYLRSLRLVSGRRSLGSSSPSHTLTVPSASGSVTNTSQWKKRQSRKKDGIHSKDDYGSEYQDTENDPSSTAGKRKADRVDDVANLYTGSSTKKPKNDEDELSLYLPDETEEEASPDNSSEDYLNKSQQSKSSDEELVFMKDLNDSTTTDDNVKDEPMEYAYEAQEIESSENFHDCSTEDNKSRNKSWCSLM